VLADQAAVTIDQIAELLHLFVESSEITVRLQAGGTEMNHRDVVGALHRLAARDDPHSLEHLFGGCRRAIGCHPWPIRS
jgi:hypothetical protein